MSHTGSKVKAVFMAVYSFSTRDVSRPKDTETLEEIKDYCWRKNINFSSLVIKLIKEWYNEERKV